MPGRLGSLVVWSHLRHVRLLHIGAAPYYITGGDHDPFLCDFNAFPGHTPGCPAR
jgi:glyoxylase-like metal-dependent hydrolase (beta-lactamase superfamily II)/ferredoxin